MEEPRTDVIRKVHVLDDDDFPYPWVEIYMDIHHNRQACEPLTAEFFPEGRSKSGLQHEDAEVIFLQPEVIDESEKKEFTKLAATVGRITYYHWMEDNGAEVRGQRQYVPGPPRRSL